MHHTLARGVTLVELLIAVAIISLLASIVLFGANQSRDKARISATENELGQMQVKMRLFLDTPTAIQNSGKRSYPPCFSGGCSSRYLHSIDIANATHSWKSTVDSTSLLSEDFYTDAWDNPYGYENNMNTGKGSTYYSSVCSMGPNKLLDTGAVKKDSATPVAGVDDICVFF